jgi:hypothetical protein
VASSQTTAIFLVSRFFLAGTVYSTCALKPKITKMNEKGSLNTHTANDYNGTVK